MKYLGDLLTADYAPRGPVVGRLITEASLNMIFGPTGSGKSYLALSIAASVMLCRPLLGFACPTARSVYYVDSEMGERYFIPTLKRVIPDSDMNCLSARQFAYRSYSENEDCRSWNISHPAYQAKYEKEIENFDVIIFDNLSGLTRPVSNHDGDLSQWQRIQPWFVRLRDKGKTIILLHHAGKSGDQRGHSDKEDPMDNVLKLVPFEAAGLGIEIRIKKGRDLKPHEKRSIRAEGVFSDTGLFWHWEYANDAVESRVERMHVLKVPKSAIAQETGLSLFRIHEIIAGIERRKALRTEVDGEDPHF